MLASHEDGSVDSPKLSPDGRSVAYLRRKGQTEQLVVRSVDSGEPTVLAEGLPRNRARLFWSPDGMRIFFGSGGTIRVVSVSGGIPADVLSVPSRDFSILPDASGVVLVKRLEEDPARAGFWLSRPIGAEPIHVAPAYSHQASSIRELGFSPDGKKLAYVAASGVTILKWPNGKSRTWNIRGARGANWFPDCRHLLVASRAEGSLIVLDTDSESRWTVAAGAYGFYTASMSSDARRVVYTFGPDLHDILEFSMNGQPTRSLAASQYMEQSPAWTRDGQGLVFRRYLGQGVLESVTAALVFQSEGDRTSRVITTLPPLGTLVPMKPSPDGKRLAYVYDEKLYVTSMAGGVPVEITPASASAVSGSGLAWSPDGSMIAYRWADAIYNVRSNGGTSSVRVVASEDSSDLFWLPSGIHAQDRERTFRVTPEGARVDIGDRIGRLTGASPDGRLLYEFDERDTRLVTRDAVTGAVVRSVTIDTDAEIRSIAVHPDGKRMAVYVNRVAYDLFLMEGFPQPTTGLERLFRRWKEPE